jgi:hypothetical protein
VVRSLAAPFQLSAFQHFSFSPVVSGQWSGGLAVLRSHFRLLLSGFLWTPTALFPISAFRFLLSTFPPPVLEWPLRRTIMSGAHVVGMYTINFVHAAYVPNNSNLRAHQPNLTDQFQRFSVSAFLFLVPSSVVSQSPPWTLAFSL